MSSPIRLVHWWKLWRYFCCRCRVVTQFTSFEGQKNSNGIEFKNSNFKGSPKLTFCGCPYYDNNNLKRLWAVFVAQIFPNRPSSHVPEILEWKMMLRMGILQQQSLVLRTRWSCACNDNVWNSWKWFKFPNKKKLNVKINEYYFLSVWKRTEIIKSISPQD